MTGKQIEDLYNSQFLGPFPYEDCKRLAAAAKTPTGDLIPELDMYFSNIAGYSSSASRLMTRPESDLKRAKNSLASDLFETYPPLEHCRGFITSERTPGLYQKMQVAEELRLALMKLLATIP